MNNKEKLFYKMLETTSFSVTASFRYLSQSSVNQHIKTTVYNRPIERYCIELHEQLIFEKHYLLIQKRYSNYRMTTSSR